MPLNISFDLEEDKALNKGHVHRALSLLHYPSVTARFDSRYPPPGDAGGIKATAVLNDTENSTVYLAHFTGKFDCGEIVLKVGESLDDIGTEAACYEDMAHLQGSSIPRFYGVFRVETKSGGYLPGLVLERFGESLQQFFDTLERGVRARILDHLVKIHKAGFILNDLEERNVLYDGSDIRLIDFKHALPHEPECHTTYDFLNAPERLTDHERDTMMCYDMYSAACEMDFWESSEVVIHGINYVDDETLPSDQAVIDALKPHRLCETYPLHLYTLLPVFYRIVHKEMEAGKSVKDVQDDMDALMDQAERECAAELSAA
ncbi:hypothetical protein VNI00_000649 [Paramarasmius palmivorus]|uniref:Protein kinase domain-containing protein n=1 Tax=Paramarasmius palmivorus TaxID=297713 RepID=A0AAW0E613_9AGAR